MSEKSKRHVLLESPHGKPVVIVPIMVTHIGSRGGREADVFLVGGASVAVKGTPMEVADALFG